MAVVTLTLTCECGPEPGITAEEKTLAMKGYVHDQVSPILSHTYDWGLVLVGEVSTDLEDDEPIEINDSAPDYEE